MSELNFRAAVLFKQNNNLKIINIKSRIIRDNNDLVSRANIKVGTNE